MPQQIAFFDFDGTITTKDTLLELAKFHKGKAGYLKGMLLLLPSLMGLKLGLTGSRQAKEKFLHYFFGGMHKQSFEDLCLKFTHKKLESLLRKEAMDKLNWHRQQDHEIVVVSASAKNWVAPFCQLHEWKYITTALEIKNDCISGNLSGENCNGAQKAIRIKEVFDIGLYEKIFAYGDSRGDKEMLALATDAFYRKF